MPKCFFENDDFTHNRGATGAARGPKPGKAPIMGARRRCRRRLIFFKIEVRPRPCRPYRVRRRCIKALMNTGKSGYLRGKNQLQIPNFHHPFSF
jgi:hypothetical protein